MIEPGQEVYPTGIDEEFEHRIIFEPEITLPDEEVYLSDFPGVLYENNGIHLKNGYRFLLLTLNPVQHEAGKLAYYDEMTVTIELKPGSAIKNFRGGDVEDILGFDFVNPGDIDTYPKVEKRDGESYEYVIITTEEYRDVFQRLADWKSTRGSIRFPLNISATAEPNNITGYVNYLNGSIGGGFNIFLDSLSTKVVLLENITSNSSYWYDGLWGDGGDINIFNDTQCQIRNFVKMAYSNWGTEYVLLGGDADEPIIPCRKMQTKFACDMYYGCLDGNWDNDSDGIFGEDPLNSVGEEADFFAEVYIGRAPVDSLTEANNFVNKTIAYEQSTTQDEGYLKNSLMMGNTLDLITEGGTALDAVTEIIPQFSHERIYTRDGTKNKSRMIEIMNEGVHIVNYDGHSSPNGFYGINQNDVKDLINDEYFLIYSTGCDTGKFDNNDAIGETFVTSSGGAFAFIGNSKKGWYSPGSINGHSRILHRSFFNVLTQTTHLGKALQYSKEQVSIGYLRYGYRLNILGDPETQLKINITTPTAHFTTPISEGEYLVFPPTHSGIIEINGTAKRGDAPGSTFKNFTVEYGMGLDPQNWSTLGIVLYNNGMAEIDNGLLTAWDTTLVDEGPITLRLTVNDNDGQIGRDWIRLFIANTPSVHNINKNKNYTSIQAAVDDANRGDTLLLGNRTYYENVRIKKKIFDGNNTISLIGEDREGVIIDGCGIRNVVEIYEFGVNLHNITITNSGNRGGCNAGIIIYRSKYHNISKINIMNNTIGILVDTGERNIIKDCDIFSNDLGITVNEQSIDNLIYNNFFNNTNNALDKGNNIWNISKTLGTNIIGGPYLGGNFWSDSIGDDVDGDGIGETPYDIPPNGINIDQLPLWKLKPASIISLRSGKDHAGTMYWIDLNSFPLIEPRLGGVELIEFNLSCSVSLVSASVECLLNDEYDPAISVTYVDQDTIRVYFDPPLPDQDVSLITLGGNASGSCYVRVLTGEIYYNGIITIDDTIPIIERFGQMVTASNFRYDINTDGSITTADYTSVKQRLGNMCPYI